MYPAFVESIFHYYRINYYWSGASKFITIEYFFAPNINMNISTERGGRVSTLSGLGTNVIKVH
jgi:hypothetical protein